MAYPGCGAIERSAPRPWTPSRRLGSVWPWSGVLIWTSPAPQAGCTRVFLASSTPPSPRSRPSASLVRRGSVQRKAGPTGRAPMGGSAFTSVTQQGRVVGWKDEVDEPAAEVVRSIVRDLLAGITLRAVTARLNAEGSAAPLGGKSITSSVRKIAVRDLNVGIRRHGKDTYQGAWEPIVGEGDHAMVKALLSDPGAGLRGWLPVPTCSRSASDAAGSARACSSSPEGTQGQEDPAVRVQGPGVRGAT